MPRRKGFTLVEMLVVLGIILVLMGLLIPTIIYVQKQAKLTQCQTRLRSIGQALQSYVTDYDQTLPPGGTSNSKDSSTSMASMGSEGKDVQRGLFGGLGSKGTSDLDYFKGAKDFPYPTAPVAFYLAKYMPVNEKNWNCPAMRVGKPGSFRNYQFVMSSAAGLGIAGVAGQDEMREGAVAGSKFGVEEFKPGYMYMSGVENSYSINKASIEKDEWHIAATVRYHYLEMRERSISGLKLSEIKPMDTLPQDVVTMTDYASTAHSKTSVDMYDLISVDSKTLDLGEKMYVMNFLYLDGHAERKEFKGVRGYLALLHGPVRQPW